MSAQRPGVFKRNNHQQHLAHHNDDTAPFDVEAFLAILNGGGTEAAANHYGGGTDSAAEHYADEGHGAIKHYCSEHCDFNDGSDYADKSTCPNDGFWCDEHNDYCFDGTKYNNDVGSFSAMSGEQTADTVAKAANEILHELRGVEPCETACVHVFQGNWTILGLANVIARRAARRTLEQTADYVAQLERLLDASFELCNHIGTGYEPHGQSMSASMAQQAVREFRQAVGRAIAARNDGQDGGGSAL